MQANLTISIHPLAASPDTLRRSPLTHSHLATAIHSPNFIFHVTIAACKGRVESTELRGLPERLQGSVVSGMSCSKETQQKALDVLLCMGLVHCVSSDGGGYALMSGVVGQLLVSLLYSCFAEGDRLLSHKCSQFMVMLYR